MATKKKETVREKATIESKLKLVLHDRERTKKAINWFYTMAAQKLKRGKVPEEAFGVKRNNNVFIGGMFLYKYDPKWKDTLPWYDTLPCVIPVELYEDGWLGLNVHYLPPMLRAVLMDKLIEYRKRALSDRAYMAVSYKLLKSVVKTKLFAPCVHRYLASHVQSRLIQVSDEYWEDVAMLPLQQFEKKSARQVWRATGTAS